MTVIKAITYAESREAFFEKQLKRARRGLDNVVKYGTDPDACAEKGEIVSFYRDALEALREKVERENPEPLTLDELRQMDGEPVWIQNIKNPERSRWELMTYAIYSETIKMYQVRTCFAQKLACIRWSDNYGKTWLAYRIKPLKGGE